MVAQESHKLQVVGSIPTSAPREINSEVRVSALHAESHWFKSSISHLYKYSKKEYNGKTL